MGKFVMVEPEAIEAGRSCCRDGACPVFVDTVGDVASRVSTEIYGLGFESRLFRCG